MHPGLRHYYYYSSPLEALPPDYESLSNLELYVDYSGLAVGTTNDYGVVDGSGNVTTLKSLAPSTTGRDFTSTGTAPTLTVDGILNSTGTLRAGVASKTWANFLHYNATIANLKHTVRAVVKFGAGSDPNAFIGLLGNNGGSLNNKGFSAFFDDRAANSRNNGMGSQITRAVGGSAVLDAYQSETITPNTFVVVRIETRFDISINGLRHSLFVNNVLQGVATTSASTAVVTTPTYDLEIFGIGNAGGAGVATLKELLIQSAIDDGETASVFDEALMTKHGITASSTTPTVDITRSFAIIDTQNVAGKYYLSSGLDINPTKPYLIAQYFVEDESHVPTGTRIIRFRKSLDYGVTWSALSTIYDPSGDLNPGDIGGGYSDNGRLHIFADVRTINATPWFITYLYSDDDGANWTTVDITSVLPSDSLAATGMYGNLIENNGVLMFPFYKVTNSGDITESANYLLRSTDGGANWSVITVRSKGATYMNEGTVIGLDSDHVLYIARNDDTNEWNQWISADNGLTWTDQGALTFGQTLTDAGPCRLTKFKMAGTDVIACWHPDRQIETMMVSYGVATDIIADGVSGWLATITVVNTGRKPHYGDYCHPMNNFNTLMGTAYELGTADNADNDFITAVMVSSNYASVKTALGL